MSENVNPGEVAPTEPSEAAVLRKVWLRLIPYLLLLFVVNIIDRGNIAIARLQMVDELKILSKSDYALGAGSFFVGYLLFQIPATSCCFEWERAGGSHFSWWPGAWLPRA